MKLIETGIDGLLVIEPKIFGDHRGYFFESFSQKEFDDAVGSHTGFVQDNESFSGKGVLRGLHFQKGKDAQAKLVRVIEGEVWDVAVDLRPKSPTFGRHFGVTLTGENHLQFFIPRGFAHGFLVLSKTALFQYKCDNYYAPQSEDGIIWDDPTLSIPWPLDEGTKPILSDRDLRHQTFETYLLQNKR